MKLSIDRDLLLKSLRRCDLRGGQLGNAALACVTLTAERIPDMPGGLDLSATNGLLGVATMVAALVERESKVAINCKRLLQVVATMPQGAVALESKPAQQEGELDLFISSGKRKFRERTFPLADVKVLPNPTPTREVRVPARDLARAFARVSYAVADVGNDHAFRKGVFLDIEPDTLHAVVIANHNVTTQTLSVKTGKSFQALIPDLALAHARDLCEEEGDGTITLSANEDYTCIDNSTTRVLFAPPKDPYLAWRQVLASQSYMPICRVPRFALLEALKAVIVAADDPDPAMWVRLLPSGVLRLDLYDKAGRADFHDEVPVTDVTGQALPTFMANPSFLLDALQAADLDCVLECLDTGRQIALKSDEQYFWTGSLVWPKDPSASPPPLDGPPPGPARAEPEPSKKGGRRPRSDEST